MESADKPEKIALEVSRDGVRGVANSGERSEVAPDHNNDIYDQSKLELLHIEDNAESQALFRDSLHNTQEYEFSFESANTLKQAQSILEKKVFDAILLDMQLPDSMGLSTLKSIFPFALPTPIIVLTQEQDNNLIREAMRNGADNHLSKSDLKPDLIELRVLMTIERKSMEHELATTKERFELALCGSSAGLWDVNLLTDELFWSNRYKELLGITDKDFVPHFSTFKSRLHPDDKDRVLEALSDHLNNRNIYDIEYRLRHEGGHYLWIHARGEALWDSDGNPIRMAGSVDDITVRKSAENEKQELELQLRHTQKLESVGQLAAGIAHEINTPIQFIGDNLKFLRESFDDIKPLLQDYRQAETALETLPEQEILSQKIKEVREKIDLEFLLEEIPDAQTQAEDGVRRVSEIVRAMKEFSHPPADDMRPADINKAMANTLVVARNEYKYVAETTTDFADIPMVPCLIGDISQVFLNLVVNAGHAIEDARESDSEPLGLIQISTIAGEEFVEIRVKDSGCGIPEEIRSKIFDPFFTTKEVGRGTGQGLAITQNIVCSKHGGELNVESNVGQGTTMIVRLPASRADSNSSAA